MKTNSNFIKEGFLCLVLIHWIMCNRFLFRWNSNLVISSHFRFVIRNDENQENYAWPQCGTNSGSSHVRLWSSKTLPSPQAISRGWPSTHVISLWQSPGTGKRGNGQNLAACECDGTFVGHLKPMTAAKMRNIINNVMITRIYAKFIAVPLWFTICEVKIVFIECRTVEAQIY